LEKTIHVKLEFVDEIANKETYTKIPRIKIRNQKNKD
jgi:hypothetical protein